MTEGTDTGDITEMMILSKLCKCVCVCVHVPGVLFAAVAEEPFLLADARGVGVAFGAGERFSAVPFSGVWKSQQKRDKLFCDSL